MYVGQALCRRHKASGLHHLAVPYFDFINAIRYVGRRSNLSPTPNAGRFVRFSHDCVSVSKNLSSAGHPRVLLAPRMVSWVLAIVVSGARQLAEHVIWWIKCITIRSKARLPLIQ